MPIDPNRLTITHRLDEDRFEIVVDNQVAVLNYTRQGHTLLFTHTGVPHALEGQGIGSRLVKTGLDYARVNNFKVVPVCWFVAKYIQRHPEYRVLLKQ